MPRGVDIPRVAALDGLRGAAVAGVLLFHGGYLTGGYLGVDLFFVLSGFLITSLLLAESDSSGRIGLGSFWARRARRLVPALAGLMAGIVVYCLVFAAPTELGQIRGDALATFGYVANWRAVFASQDYFALFERPSPLHHTWSLAIEEQFYLVWPLVFVGLSACWKRSAPKAVFAVAVSGAAASSVLMFLLYDASNVSRAYYGTDARAAGILMGAALAAALTIWGPARGPIPRAILACGGAAGIGLLAIAWTRLGGQEERLYRGGFVACGLAATAVIATVTHPQAGLLSRALSWRPLCRLGLISYGVYLWHWPVYVALDPPRTGLGGVTLLGVRIAVTLVIAVASYIFLERPIRHGAGIPVVWRVLTPAVGIVLVGLIVGVTAGSRPLETVPAGSRASTGQAVAKAARIVEADRILVVGNSVGWFLGRALEEIQTSSPKVVLDGALPACVFPSGAQAIRSGNSITQQNVRDCDASWIDELREFRPDTVLFIYGETGSDDYLYGGRWLTPCTPAYDRLYRRGLVAAIRQFQQAGARVVVTTVAYASLAAAIPKVGGAYLRATDCSNRVRRRAVRETGAQVVDLFDFTCPRRRCRASVNGIVLRSDGIHYRDEGARIVARWILPQLPRPATGASG